MLCLNMQMVHCLKKCALLNRRESWTRSKCKLCSFVWFWWHITVQSFHWENQSINQKILLKDIFFWMCILLIFFPLISKKMFYHSKIAQNPPKLTSALKMFPAVVFPLKSGSPLTVAACLNCLICSDIYDTIWDRNNNKMRASADVSVWNNEVSRQCYL